MVNIRISQAISYVLLVIGVLVGLSVVLWLIEGFVNSFIAQPLRWKPLELRTPVELIMDAVGLFPDLWDIGTMLFFGLVEELTFAGYAVFTVLGGIVAAALPSAIGATVLIAVGAKLKEISTEAGGKAKPP